VQQPNFDSVPLNRPNAERTRDRAQNKRIHRKHILRHDPSLDFLRYAFNHVIDQLEKQQLLLTEQQWQIAEVERHQEILADRVDEQEDRIGSAESNISYLTHQIDRNAELEYMENPYAMDGSPRCDY
jgi:septal ring factor EnvC (AmiA/AmiB activator)